MIVNKIQGYYIYLYETNHLVIKNSVIKNLTKPLKTYNEKFYILKFGLKNQSSKPLEVEHRIKLTLVLDPSKYMLSDKLYVKWRSYES